METNDKIYLEIREILAKNKDAEKGFDQAANNAESPDLKTYFANKSRERRIFNQKLISEIKIAYSDFDETGSFSGTIHRAWMDVKALFSGSDDESMLAEAIRGDKAAIKEYEDVLHYKKLPAGLHFLLSEQREKIQMDLKKNQDFNEVN
ncbi:PA2169 family four-helix-bundle protein [Zobellia amurskyensis]|uniref:PA2169 family four-helix-bundle protein n=1 Tax=Zobellia amurskyensis TaxID=248905 RepID=A0A7X2ZXR0_9FLAO|nr:PA2169 family four-helix-bundle protein [Zobellia amurskyensis]MUH38321.1 PA2169 family four-helix-bundle protein [Zobellia amurskyensis]